MRVAVIGSRETRGLTLEEVLPHIPQNASELVSGGARGVDRLAEDAARRLHLPIKIFAPDYERHGYIAPLLRNLALVDYADLVLAFWDNRSKGTAHALNHCIETNKPFRIISIRDK